MGKALQVAGAVTEGGLGLPGRGGQGGGGLGRPGDDADAAPAPAGGRLDRHRPAVGLADDHLGEVGDPGLLCRGRARPGGQHHPAGGQLVAHLGDGLQRRALQTRPAAVTAPGEAGVLAEQPVAGVDGPGPGLGRGGQQLALVQVGVGHRHPPMPAARSASRTCSARVGVG